MTITFSGRRLLGNIALLASLVCIPLLMEWIFRGSLRSAFGWASECPGAVGLSIVIVAASFGCFFAALGSRLYAWAAVASLTSFVTLCNHLKLRFLSENIYPWDILSLKQGASLFPNLQSGRELALFAGFNVLLLTLVFFGRKACQAPKPGKGSRFVAGTLGILILMGMGYSDLPAGKKLLNVVNVQNTMWDYQASYLRNGFLLSSVLKIRSSVVLPAKNYDQARAALIEDEVKKVPGDQLPLQGNQTRPNFIVILSEAFWDPLVMREVPFSEDPIPFIRKFRTQSSDAPCLLTPALFGGTCKTEFEALTGFSNSFFHPGSVPFLQYINHELPSVVSLLKNHGYQTIGVHPNDGWFWKRDQVYPLLGFEEFHSIDDFNGAEKRGPFVSDKALMEKVVTLAETGDKPKFIFVVTMQNHAPYKPGRYGADVGIPLPQGKFGKESSGALSSYMQGLRDFDASLKQLLGAVQKEKTPTVVLMFGDHLPFLGADGQTYKEAGYIKTDKVQDWTVTEQKKMRSVPFFAWANFPGFENPIKGTVSPIYLPYYISTMAGIAPPPFYRYLHSLEKKVPGLTDEVKISNGGALYKNVPPEYQQDIERYWFVQYDMMFGEKYTKRSLF